MLANTDQHPAPEGRRHPADALVRDPADFSPVCDKEEFADLVDEMVADEAPKLFAVVQEYGDRIDARCAAWGMAFDDHTDVISVDGSLHLGARTPEAAVRRFRRGSHITSRLVWVRPDKATQPEPEDVA